MSLNITFAHELLNNNYDYSKAYYYTVGEASKITKSGNPMDFVIAYKEEHDNRIPDEFLYPPEGDGGYDGYDSTINNYEQIMLDKLADDSDIMLKNIRENSIPQSQNINNLYNNKSKSIILMIIFLILVLSLIALFLLFNKKVFIVLLVIILIIGMFSFIKTKKN